MTVLFILTLIGIQQLTHATHTKILAASNVCFSAAIYNESTIFNAPIAGELVGVEFQHKSGSVTCNGIDWKLWGCGSEFMFNFMHVIDENTYYGETYYPTNETHNYSLYHNPSQSCLKGCNTMQWRLAGSNPTIENIQLIQPTYKIRTFDKFMLQYTEACCMMTVYDNDGTTCADIYFIYSSIVGYVWSDSLYHQVYVGIHSTWFTAETYCIHTFDTHLISLTNAAETTAAQNLCNSKAHILQNDACAIGYNDIESEGVYQWSDGTINTYVNWVSNQPDNDGDCVFITTSTGEWVDGPCNTTLQQQLEPFICNAPNQIFIYSENKKYVWIGPTKTYYDHSNDLCRETFGTTLASVHSDSENHEITTLCRYSATDHCFIGLSGVNINETFQWIDGTEANYFNWKIGEPNMVVNDNSGTKICASVWLDSLWHTATCNSPWYHTICNAAKWTVPSSPLLPHSSNRMAVGFDYLNNKIWMVGGYPVVTSLMSFMNNTFTDHGTTNASVSGNGQFYAQMDEYLYMIHAENGDTFDRFNVFTSVIENNFTSIPVDVGVYGCLTVISGDLEKYLAIIGGTGNGIVDVQILKLETKTWISGVPNMQEARSMASCAATNNKLYAIGGFFYGGVYRDSIEVLNVLNLDMIQNQQWRYMRTLSHGMSGSRAVIYGYMIYIVGGYYYDYINSVDTYNDIVYVIDPLFDEITIRGYMDISLVDAGAIVMDEKLYVFGGMDGSVVLNSWRYLSLPPELTLSPTTSPTTAPSTSPIAHSWSSTINLPKPLAYAASASINNNIMYIFGGSPASLDIYKWSESVHSKTWTHLSITMPSLISCESDCSSVLNDRLIYMYDSDQNDDSIINDSVIYIFDTDIDQFLNETIEVPLDVGSPCLSLHEETEKIFLIGGAIAGNPWTYYDYVQIYDINTSTWTLPCYDIYLTQLTPFDFYQAPA
eukprot:163918_1